MLIIKSADIKSQQVVPPPPKWGEPMTEQDAVRLLGAQGFSVYRDGTTKAHKVLLPVEGSPLVTVSVAGINPAKGCLAEAKDGRRWELRVSPDRSEIGIDEIK